MNRETQRLNTFANWPASAPVDPERLAKAGFFYTGQGTEVECFSCGGKISEWNYADQVMWRHQRMDPNCSFVATPYLSGNVPSVESPGMRPSLLSGGGQSTPPRQDNTSTEGDELYKTDAVRLLTLVNWRDESVSREDLVKAGFYHLGGGRLRCAWCAGELAPFRNLGSLGTPVQIHRVYFPDCTYAREVEEEMERRQEMALTWDFALSSSPPPSAATTQSPAINSNKPQSSGAEQNERVVAAGGQWRALGVVGGGARHAAQAALGARLATYERWPADRAQAPRALADAGFFYTGIDDQVRCFYCDGGLGKWEAGDAPWSEHARWFPHCGFVLLAKGQEFVDACRSRPPDAEKSLRSKIRNLNLANGPVDENQVDACMEGAAAAAALGAGLDVARVRRAICRRLRATGTPFRSSEALIDAVLDDQLNEEGWSLLPRNHSFARDILAEALLEVVPTPAMSPDVVYESPTVSPEPTCALPVEVRHRAGDAGQPNAGRAPAPASAPASVPASAPAPASDPDKKPLSLEEENRQLKEARICKVCMDGEVSVVFLPCGHLVSCAGCGAALAACPLCRAPVRALVRAYLA